MQFQENQNRIQQVEQRQNKQQKEKEEQKNNQIKNYSILPDLITGWRPKNVKIYAPILITYQDLFSQFVLQSSIACQNKLVYVGNRYHNSYLFPHIPHLYCNAKYPHKHQQISLKLQKEFQQFNLKNNSRKTPFLGMNTLLQKQLHFQADFQSGNLDFVIKVSANQYDLFLRPDTNTRGHTQWFYFKVCNSSFPYPCVKFNIFNNKKRNVLYLRGMKPFIYSKHLENTKGIKWQQAGQHIEYINLSEKQDIFQHFPQLKEYEVKMLSRYYCLSFDYTFKSSKDEVYFAYCPPFTYTEMKSYIQCLKKKSNPQIGISVKQQQLCHSLSRLQIPILTITNDSFPQQTKKYIVVTGRFHPGQSNGSYTLKGFLDQLLQNQSKYLLQKVVFKIIPMINPDGVIFGNYRTSLSGKDLNRKFIIEDIDLYPQITYFKQLIEKIKKISNNKLIYFFDFHGHSIQKNVFMYGPQYQLWSSKYQKAKMLPKLISQKTDIFRYQSCIFKLDGTKKSTARAFMLGFAPYCYTIQSSVGLYRSFIQKQNFLFYTNKWEQIGKIIAQSLKQCIQKMEKQTNVINLKNKKKIAKMIQSQTLKQNIEKLNQKTKSTKQQKQKNFTTIHPIIQKNNQNFKIKNKKHQIQKYKQKQSTNYVRKLQFSKSSSNTFSKLRTKCNSSNSFSYNKLNYPPQVCYNYQFHQINEVNEIKDESDTYSQGKSDCQSDDNDFDQQKYKSLSGQIIKIIQKFNEGFLGVKNKNFRLKNKKKVHVNINKNTTLGHKFISEQMKVVPSLKQKLLIRQQAQNQTLHDNKNYPLIKCTKLCIGKYEQQKRKST